MRSSPVHWFEQPRRYGARLNRFFSRLATEPSLVMALLLLVGCAFLSAVIPPMKSPDEPDHIERAYLLTRGVWVLERPAGKSSGGDIDTGLLDYIASYPPTQDKITAEDSEAADQIRWSHERLYDPSPGTGYYFPLIYAPQAAGLYAGERLGLTIDHSYRLARAFALLACVILIGAAFHIHAPNALTIALLVLPMTLYQFASASLDGIATALAVLALSIFLRIASDKTRARAWMHPALALTLAVLITSRIHALPFLGLLVAAWRYTPNTRTLIWLIASSLFIALWTALAMKTTVDLRVLVSAPTSTILGHYLQHPLEFLNLVGATLAHPHLGPLYVRSFMGVLGWLDTPFSPPVYTALGYGLALAAALSCSWQGITRTWPQRVLLVAMAVASVLLIFLALLITWTPHPAQTIQGIQGRYFLIPALAWAYSLGGTPWAKPSSTPRVAPSLSRRVTQLGMLVGLAMWGFSTLSTTRLVLNKYYLAPFLPQAVHITHAPANAPADAPPRRLLASPPLQAQQPIALHMPTMPHAAFGPIRRLGIRLGTHARQNPGQAELRLRTADGQIYRQVFSLSGLKDNSDYFFQLPLNHYTQGEIRQLTGGGISTWESHADTGPVLTCMKLYDNRNQTVHMAGCP